jgi:hypothetical protein
MKDRAEISVENEKEEAIRKLIAIFARDFPRRNHIILVDMSSGTYRVDEMLYQEVGHLAIKN